MERRFTEPEVAGRVRVTPERHDGRLLVGLLHPFDRLHDDLHVQDPPVEQEPPLIESDLVPRLGKIAGLVDDLRQAFPGHLSRASELVRLVTMVDSRTREHCDNLDKLREVLGPLVFDTVVRLTTRVREASRERVSGPPAGDALPLPLAPVAVVDVRHGSHHVAARGAG